MDLHDLIVELREVNKSKIVLLVADGLGGLPMTPGGKPNWNLQAPLIWILWQEKAFAV